MVISKTYRLEAIELEAIELEAIELEAIELEAIELEARGKRQEAFLQQNKKCNIRYNFPPRYDRATNAIA